jgi:DNA/RNA endonuclease G (NUC1)
MRKWTKVLAFVGLAQSNVEAESELFDKIIPSKDRYKIRKSKDLLIYYDSRTRNPAFVIEHLHSTNHSAEKLQRPTYFVENLIDEDFRVFLPSPFVTFRSDSPQAKVTDYKGSGYDRGHLAAAANFKGSKVH